MKFPRSVATSFMRRSLLAAVATTLAGPSFDGLTGSNVIGAEPTEVPAWQDLREVTLASSLDGEPQTVKWWAPAEESARARPLFVFLHSWSGDYRQDNTRWLRHAARNGWVFVHPDFRGPNRSPKACGSRWARRDILDAIDFAAERLSIDRSRIYLAGSSGGGHMAMLMAGRHPDRFSAVSAWVGISDLVEWHDFHTVDGKPQNYARMIRRSLGGPPGTSGEIDAEYRDRSAIHFLHRIGDLPLDLAAGVRDGKSGSVPIRHTLRAFNVVARSHGNEPIPEDTITTLWENGRLDAPRLSDVEADPTYDREIYLRRHSENARVTIFDGGHESLPDAACAWLARQQRPTAR